MEEAEQELIERLIEYRRYAASARWLSERGEETPRLFRIGPAPLQPRPEPVIEDFSEDPWQLHAALGVLLTSPPEIDVSVVRRKLVPVSEFLDRFRYPARRAPGIRLRAGRRRARPAVAGRGVPRGARAVQVGRGRSGAGRDVRPYPGDARRCEAQAGRAGAGRERRRGVGAGDRVSELTHTVEALLFVAPEPLSVRELVALTEAPPERVERALDALGDRYGEGRSGVVLEKAAGGWGFRASKETAARVRPAPEPAAGPRHQPGRHGNARDRGLPRAGLAPRHRADPRRVGRRRRRRAARARARRGGGPRRHRRASPCCTGSPPRSRACSGSKRVRRACRASPTSTSPTPITRRCGRGSIWWLISVPERLNRFLASTGLASRRAAEAYIREGRVTVNGAVAELGTRVSPATTSGSTASRSPPSRSWWCC